MKYIEMHAFQKVFTIYGIIN